MAIPVTKESLIAEARIAMDMAIKGRDGRCVADCLDLLRRLGNEQVTEQDNRAIKLIAELDAIPTALYRHFDHDGRLLYVGISLKIIARIMQHRKKAPWYTQIKTIDVEWHGSRSSAEVAEIRAIRAEKPLHNVTFNRVNNNAVKKPQTRVVRPGTSKRNKRKPSL